MKQHVDPSVWEQSALHLGCAGRHLWRALVAISTLPIWSAIIGSALFIAFAWSLSGCRGNAGRIVMRGGGLEGPQLGEVHGVKDAGAPATASSDTQSASIKIPAGSVITETATEAQPATESAPYRPAHTVREIKLTADTAWFERAQKISANTGTIDTSVAKHRIDAAQRIYLLWGGIASLIAGLVVKSLVPAWPSFSSGLLLAGVALIGAWKFAEIPAWISLVIVGVVLALIAGYKRAEWDANRNGVPDFLEKKQS